MTARGERIAQRRREARRRTAASAGLLGLIGIGLGTGAAVLTSAAWTDQVWWAGAVETGTADLEGSLDGSTWVDSDDAGAIELVLPGLDDLRPGDTITRTIHLRNTGTLDAELSASATGSGALFDPPAPVTATLSGLPATLAGGASASGTLIVTAPDWSGQQHMGETGSITVTVTGAVP